MERSKLKLAVILLLALLNVVLLGMIIHQDRESLAYAEVGRTQAMIWLESNGITAQEESIPWESGLAVQGRKLEEQVLEALPDGLPEGYTIQSRRAPETLLRDFVMGLRGLGVSCGSIRSVTEGYVYDPSDRLLTPVWQIETDQGRYQLDGHTGALAVL